MSNDPARPSEVRADAILARIDAADLDALAAALARLLISAARAETRPRRPTPSAPIDRPTTRAARG